MNFGFLQAETVGGVTSTVLRTAQVYNFVHSMMGGLVILRFSALRRVNNWKSSSFVLLNA